MEGKIFQKNGGYLDIEGSNIPVIRDNHFSLKVIPLKGLSVEERVHLDSFDSV